MASFASSYIKTVASQVTRSADSASMTGTNFSDWYRQDEGAFYAQAKSIYNVQSAPTRYLLANALTNAYYLYANNNDANIRNFDGSNNLPASYSGFNTDSKFATSYGSGSKSIVVNGGTVASGSYNGQWRLNDSLSIGNSTVSGSNYWNGHIKKIAYYPKALSATELQALTS